MGYKHLDYLKRCKIQAFWKAGYTEQQIADEIGVNKSTISREFSRNMVWVHTRLGYWAYKADYAQAKADDRKKNKRKRIKFTDQVKSFVIEKIQEDWSPEQICGYAKRHTMFSLSHERIYQFLLEDRKQGGLLYMHLRHQHKKYRKRYGSPKREGPVKDRVTIDDRPLVVDEKSRIGDWEIDTIVGKQHKNAIVTLVERFSKFTLIGKVGSKKSDYVKDQTIALLKPFEDYTFTITSDNGGEFALHKEIASALRANIYFAHPYHSWERGLNENTNGLIRQYFPKRSDFSELTDDDIIHAQSMLNNRPRKSLDYMTPAEVFLKEILTN
jgi:IS30 family transposase